MRLKRERVLFNPIIKGLQARTNLSQQSVLRKINLSEYVYSNITYHLIIFSLDLIIRPTKTDYFKKF